MEEEAKGREKLGDKNEPSQMPLLINEVAERVLDFVPVSDLKNCRRVCKIWWKESLVRFRRTHWLNLSMYMNNAGRRENHFSLKSDHEKEGKRMKKCLPFKTFVSHLEDPYDPYQLKNHPFEHIKFFKSKFEFSSSNRKLEWFRTQYGPFVKSLTMDKCTITTKEDFYKIIFRLSPKLEYLCLSDNLYKAKRPKKKKLTSNLNVKNLLLNENDVQNKLTHLKLSMRSADSTDDDQLPLSWPQFLAHFPNMQLVNIDQTDHVQAKGFEIEHILSTIHALQTQRGILQHFTGLDLLNEYGCCENSFDTSILPLMKNLLPLTFFAYDIGYDNEFHHDDNSIHELVGYSSKTLETLIIYKAPFRGLLEFLPFGNSFPHLQKLTLVGPIVKDLRFVEHTPSLKILRLFHDITDEYKVVPIIPVTKVIHQLRTFRKDDGSLTLKFLEIEDAREERVTVVGNTNFTLMSHLTLPNMEELIIGLERCTAANVEQLARLMPNVKRLRIGLSNSGFRAVCKNWKGLEALDISPVKVNEQGITGIVPRETIRRPNLTDLKYLRALGFGDEQPHYRFSELTDFSLENGLMQLHYLERVSVMCSPSKMSEENYKKLNARFSSSFVRRFIPEEFFSEEHHCLENPNGNGLENCDDW